MSLVDVHEIPTLPIESFRRNENEISSSLGTACSRMCENICIFERTFRDTICIVLLHGRLLCARRIIVFVCCRTSGDGLLSSAAKAAAAVVSAFCRRSGQSAQHNATGCERREARASESIDYVWIVSSNAGAVLSSMFLPYNYTA